MAVVLGLNASFTANHHDPSAALVIDGTTFAAIEEERLNRVKTSIGLFPARAIKFCLDRANVNIRDVDFVCAPGIASPDLVSKIRCALIHEFGYAPKIELLPHYMCHAAGAFFGSGFRSSLVVSMDGYGDGISTWIASAEHGQLTEIASFPATNSIGNFYVAFTERLGFIRTEGEFKVMGMAAFGNPRFDLSAFLRLTDEGYWSSPDLTIKAHRISSTFEACVDHDRFDQLGFPKRDASSKRFDQAHFDLAASVQSQFEEVYVGLIQRYAGRFRSLCLTGGCALNCLANRRLLDLFEDVYVMPAASDRGLSLGAALLFSAQLGDRPGEVNSMYLGQDYSLGETVQKLSDFGINHQVVDNPGEMAAQDIMDGYIVGWHASRSEFGPRALGARSIVAKPDMVGMKDRINRKIKFREAYRPFAPAILESAVREHGLQRRFPYMTIAVTPPASLAAHISETVHADGTTRIQTVADQGEPFSDLLVGLRKLGGFPAVINTSFNLAGEPIVETPLDAVRTFYSSGMDTLYVGHIRLAKQRQQ